MLPDLTSGAIVGLVLVVSAVAYAGLIYSGPLAPGLLIGVAAMLGGTAIGVIVIALRTDAAGILGAPYGALAVIYALLPGQLGLDHPGLHDPVAAAGLVTVVCGLVSLFTGAVFWLLGRFRLAEFARFLPFPVVAGYIGAVGWLFMIGGLDVGASLHPAGWSLAPLIVSGTWPKLVACAGFGILAVGLARHLRHWAIVPGMLVASMIGFHAIRLSLGVSVGQAVAAGWLLGPFKAGRILALPPWGAASHIGWPMLQGIGPVGLSILLVGTITTIMSNAGLELQLNRMIDSDHEIETAGIATIASGFLGGIITAPHIPSTMLARRMGAHGRIAGVVAGLCCGLALLSGTAVLSLLPRFVVGGLLIFNGLDLMIDRVWNTRRLLSVPEWSAVLLVLATAAIAGFMSAVVMGLALTLVIFVLSYRRIPVIQLEASGATHRSLVRRPPAADSVLQEQGNAIRIIRLQGYLFFLNANRLLPSMPPVGTRILILDFRAVPDIDISAAITLQRMHQTARDRQYAVVCTGLNKAVRKQFELQRLPIASTANLASCRTEAEALQLAEEMLLADTALRADNTASLAALMQSVLGRDVPHARLAPYLEPRYFAAGEILTRQGEAPDTMALISSGRVSIEVERASAAPLCVAIAEPGVIVGELGFYTGEVRSATVRAITDTEADLVTRAALARMAAEAPDLAALFQDLMMRLLARKLIGNTRLQAQAPQ